MQNQMEFLTTYVLQLDKSFFLGQSGTLRAKKIKYRNTLIGGIAQNGLMYLSSITGRRDMCI